MTAYDDPDCIHGVPLDLPCSYCKAADERVYHPPSGANRAWATGSGGTERPNTTSAYDTRCPDCGDRIEEGDVIYLRDDRDGRRWVCEECV